MKEILNSLSEMLDKKEVKSLNILYERVGDAESLSATVMKEDEDISVSSDGETTSNITINVDGITCSGGLKIEDFSKEIQSRIKRMP